MTCASDIKYQMSSMPFDAILNHLLSVKTEFRNHEESFYLKYAKKLYTNASFVLARHNDNIVGIIAFYANNLPMGYITHVWVSKTYRRTGICNEMLNIIKCHCKNHKFVSIQLEVNNFNKPAILTYTKNGYKYVKIGPEKSLMELTIV